MKNILLLFAVFMFQFLNCYSIDNWEVQIPGNRGGFHDVFFVAQEGWAVGYSSTVANRPSTILYTSDNGKNWMDQSPGTSVILTSVYFTNNKVGWIVGKGSYILNTTDGGINWISKRLWGDVNFQCITFTDENTGWIIGDDQLNNELVLYKTTNAGIDWIKSVFDLPCSNLSNIYFSDPEHGWIAGNYPTTIIKTTDGGESWIPNEINFEKSINSLFFISENEGWAVGGSYDRINGSSILIIHTTDGGESWETQLDSWAFYLNDVKFVDNKNGWAIGGTPAVGCGNYSSYIINTTDGGINWISQYIPVENMLTGLFIDKQLNAWAVGVDNFGDGCILYSGLKLNDNKTDISLDLKNYENVYIFPNPAVSDVNIRFLIPGLTEIKCSIYDIYGKTIMTFLDNTLIHGHYSLKWDCRDKLGSVVPNGIYICCLYVNGKLLTNTFKIIR